MPAQLSLPEIHAFLDSKPGWLMLTTLGRDGYPHTIPIGYFRLGEEIYLGCRAGTQKLKNIARDPRVAVAVSAPGNPTRYFQVRGRVVNVTTDGAVDHIEKLAQKYLGKPYPWYGGRDQVRVIISIEPEKISSMG